MELGLDDRSVLVLAGTSGLGLGAAEAFVSEGAAVTVCSRSEENLVSAKRALEEVGGGTVRAEPCDITDPDDIRAVVDVVVDAEGGLDHVVASTGSPAPGTLAELDDRDWYRAFDLLIMSLVWTLDASSEHLRESPGGTFVAIASTSVREPVHGIALSNVIRRGVIGLVKTASRELAPDVRTNAVLPGPFETPRLTQLMEASVERGDDADLEEARRGWTDPVPLGRLGDPRELGDMIAVLSSDRANFVTGSVLPVDGGRLRS